MSEVRLLSGATMTFNIMSKATDFEKFWQLYGRKIDRKRCLTTWNRLSQKQIDLILKHVPKYVAATPDVQFRKFPRTYLNGECWLDEMLPADTQEEKKADDSKLLTKQPGFINEW